MHDNLNAVEQRVRDLAQHTGLDIRLGYVGNLDGRNDYRIWFIWVMNARGGDKLHPNNLTTVLPFGLTTEALNDSIDAISEAALYAALQRDGVRPVEVIDTWGEVTQTTEESRAVIEAFRQSFRERFRQLQQEFHNE